MSSQYDSLQATALYPEVFHVPAPAAAPARAVWPRQEGVFIRLAASEVSAAGGTPEPEVPPEADADAQAADAAAPARAPLVLELVSGQFGLVPRWVKSASDAKLRATKLVNARADVVTTSSNFRDAWLNGQRCIVPMMSFLEDDWRSGKALPTRITRVDGRPMGVAGLWERWTGADGEVIVSYALLTVNANSHALMHRYQHPGNDKTMPAILNEGAFEAWFGARPEKAREFLRAYPANQLTANPVERKR